MFFHNLGSANNKIASDIRIPASIQVNPFFVGKLTFIGLVSVSNVILTHD